MQRWKEQTDDLMSCDERKGPNWWCGTAMNRQRTKEVQTSFQKSGKEMCLILMRKMAAHLFLSFTSAVE